jgi:threonine/homoserine/homoserine lactone efflux protein
VYAIAGLLAAAARERLAGQRTQRAMNGIARLLLIGVGAKMATS